MFNALTGYSDPPKLKKLVMAPTDLRRRFQPDRSRAAAGRRRSAGHRRQDELVVDKELIEALYNASAAGVIIQPNVRGICTLRPGCRISAPNIEVISVVDRFLEHSRIYYFLNGGNEQVFLSSADWMTRNLDKRVELMFPVEDAEARAKVVYALRAMFRDNAKTRRPCRWHLSTGLADSGRRMRRAVHICSRRRTNARAARGPGVASPSCRNVARISRSELTQDTRRDEPQQHALPFGARLQVDPADRTFLNSRGFRAPINRAASSPRFGSCPTNASAPFPHVLRELLETAVGVPAGARASDVATGGFAGSCAPPLQCSTSDYQ